MSPSVILFKDTHNTSFPTFSQGYAVFIGMILTVFSIILINGKIEKERKNEA